MMEMYYNIVCNVLWKEYGYGALKMWLVQLRKWNIIVLKNLNLNSCIELGATIFIDQHSPRK